MRKPHIQVTAVLFFLFAISRGEGAERTFQLSGVPMVLQEVSGTTEIYYSAMRFNRVSNVWNVEMSVKNSGTVALQSPLVLQVTEITGSPGLVGGEGTGEGTLPYFDLSGKITERLMPGGSSAPMTLTLLRGDSTPALKASVYSAVERLLAAGMVQTLDWDGQILGGVEITEEAAAGSRQFSSDADFGVASLGTGPGDYRWKFTRPGYYPVWRGGTIMNGNVAQVPAPRLTKYNPVVTEITTLNGGKIIDGTAEIEVLVEPGSVQQNSIGRVTPLDGQSLPGFLPIGWSPLQAFWFELGAELERPASVNLKLWGPLEEGGALARWNELTLQWEVVEMVSGSGTDRVGASLNRNGAYAVVGRDSGSFAPPVPVVGLPLGTPNAGLPILSGLSAGGSVTPPSRSASLNPQEVTGTAEVIITNPNGVIPSGVVLPVEVLESYKLRAGTEWSLPRYQGHIVFYQRPGDGDEKTARSSFGVRPTLLFGSETLGEAKVQLDVLGETEPAAIMVGPEGGETFSGGIRLRVGAGTLDKVVPVELKEASIDDLAGFNTEGVEIVRAFEVSLSDVTENGKVAIEISSGEPGGNYVVARAIVKEGYLGLEPIERLIGDASGILRSAEPVSGARLPGLTGPGKYVVARLKVPHGLIHGVARNSTGAAVRGLVVQVNGQPWLTFSGEGGVYRLLAPVGAAVLNLTDGSSGDQGLSEVTISGTPLEVSLSTAQTGPKVVRITPAAGTENVPRVSSVIIEFSEPVKPESVTKQALQLIAGTNGPALFSHSLNLQNTILTILPLAQLPADSEIIVRLLDSIRDASGFALEGTSEFKFKTETALLNRVAGQVVIYEPENGVAGITGSAGTAEPEGVVILVNENSGFTATVLAKADGSFTNSIPAEVDDFLSAVVVNGNGTRTQIPASRQLFKDGAVGLYNQGGILEAESDGKAVQVIIQPGEIPTKTKFKMESVSVAQILAAMQGAEPVGGKLVKGLKMKTEGDEIPSGGKVSMDVTVDELDLPEGTTPEESVFALTVAREVNGVRVYEIIDKMTYKDGKLTTASPPFDGIMGFFANNPGEALLSALRVAFGKEAVVHGRVFSEIPGNASSRRPLPGAVAFVSPSTATQLVDENRRLKNGAIVATADETGEFALVISLPFVSGEFAGDGFPVLAVSSLFPDQIISMPALFPPEAVKPVAGATLVFDRNPTGGTIEGEDNTPPGISIAHGPSSPTTNDTVRLRILANDNREMDRIIVDVVSVNSIVEGIQPTLADVVLSGPVDELNRGQNMRQERTITVAKPAQVQMYIQAYDKSGNGSSALYNLEVRDQAPPTLPVPDPNDNQGPFVTSSNPAIGAIGVLPHKPIVLQFNEPMDSGSLSNYSSALSFSPPATISSASVGTDFESIVVQCADLKPNTAYTLTANANLRDLNGNGLDQNPYNAVTNESFTMTFTTAPFEAKPVANVQSGGGVVANGRTLFVIDRAGANEGTLSIVNATDPSAPQVVKKVGIGEFPRDLGFIPKYEYKLQSGGVAKTNDLLAIVGGRVGGEGQWLEVLNVSDPTNPTRVAFAYATKSPTAAITKIAWAPPVLAYLEADADVNAIAYVNLQLFLYSDNLSGEDFANEPLAGAAGKDANGDGDFADSDDEIPRPRGGLARVGMVNNGLVRSFSIEDYSTQRIEDFAINFGGNFLAVVTSAGKGVGGSGADLPSQFLPLANGGTILNAGSISEDLPQRSKRVTCFFGVPFLEGARTNLLNLAFVTGSDALIVLDITDIQNPTNFALVPIRSIHGAPQSVSRREDGLIQVATSQDVLLLNTALLQQTVPNQSNGVHPSIVGIIPGMGSGIRSFVGTAGGFYAVAGGGNVKVFGGPNRVDLVAHRPGSIFAPGKALSEAVELNPLQLIVSVNEDYDEATDNELLKNLLRNTPKDFARVKPLFEDNDLIRIDLKQLPIPEGTQNPQTIELIINLPGAMNQALRLYNETGHELSGVNYGNGATVTLQSPYNSQFGLLSGLAAQEKTFFLEVGSPTESGSIEYKLIDADGSVIGSDKVMFSAVRYEITDIWSAQFPGSRANRLPGQAGNGTYGAGRPNNFILMAPEAAGDIMVGAKVKIEPDSPSLRARVQLCLLQIRNATAVEETKESAFVTSGGSSVEQDGTHLIRSADDRSVFVLPMSFQFYLEYFVAAGIDYNIDGQVGPEEVNTVFGGARVNSSGLPRILYNIGDIDASKQSQYHLIEEAHLKVINQSLFLNSYGIMNAFLSAAITGIGFTDDDGFPNLSVAHLLSFMSSTPPVLSSPRLGPNPIIAGTAQVSATTGGGITFFEQAHNVGQFSGSIRTVPKYTYTQDSLIPQKVRHSGRFRLMIERVLAFPSNRTRAHSFFAANPDTSEHTFEFLNTDLSGNYYDNFPANCLRMIMYDWLHPSPTDLANIFLDSFNGCNDFDLAFGIGGFSIRPHLKTRVRVRCEGLPYNPTSSVLRAVEVEVLEGSMEDLYDWDLGVDTYMAVLEAGHPHFQGFTGLTPGQVFVYSIPLAGPVENFQTIIPAPQP